MWRNRDLDFHRGGAGNGFCVLRLKVRGHKALETLIRHAPSVTVGDDASSIGERTIDREYGRQFKVGQLRVLPPPSKSPRFQCASNR